MKNNFYNKISTFLILVLALAFNLILAKNAMAGVPVVVVRDMALEEYEAKHLTEASFNRGLLEGIITALILNDIQDSNDGLYVKNFDRAISEPPRQAWQESLDNSFKTRFKDAPNSAKIKNNMEKDFYDKPSYNLETRPEDVFNASKGGGYETFLNYLSMENNDYGISLLAEDQALQEADEKLISEQTKMTSNGYLPKEKGTEVVTPSGSVKESADQTQRVRMERLNSNNCNDTIMAVVDIVFDVYGEGMYSKDYSASGGALSGIGGSLASSILCASTPTPSS